MYDKNLKKHNVYFFFWKIVSEGSPSNFREINLITLKIKFCIIS
jgi:hypothetical protein